MRTAIRNLLLLSVLAALWAGCGGPPSVVYFQDHEDHDQVIAEVGERFEITMADLYDSLYGSGRLPNGGIGDTAWVRMVLDSILVDTLMGLAAWDVPLSEHYEYYRTYRLRWHDAILRHLVEEMVYAKVETDSQKIADFYHENDTLFWLPEQVFVRHILVSPENLRRGPDSLAYAEMSDEQLKEAAGEYARKLKRMIEFGEPFSEVAVKYSHDVDAHVNRGTVGWTGRGRFRAPFDSVAFGADIGEVTEPYYDDSGWHILQIDYYLEEGVPPLDTIHMVRAANTYQTVMQNRRSAKLRDSLNSLPVNIEYNEEALKEDPYRIDKQQWVAIVNAEDTIDANMLRGPEAAYRARYKRPSEDAETRREMIREMAERFVALQAARDLGIDTLPAVVEEEKRLRQHHSKLIVEKNIQDPGWTPSDSMIRAYYDSNIVEFTVAKPMNLIGLMVADSSYAAFLKDQGRSGFTFQELASQFQGNEPGLRPYLLEYGDVGPEDVDSTIWRAASLTSIGDITDPVSTPSGYVIVKVVSRKSPKELHRVSGIIRGRLIDEHELTLFKRYRDQLYEEFDVRFPNPLQPVHLRPLEMRNP